MQKITRENYEIIFIDYIDKNLSPPMVEQLEIFLTENPDLKIELEAYNVVTLAPYTTDHFEQKNQLKKIEPANLEEQLVAYTEGDLNKNQRRILESLTQEQPAMALEIAKMKTIKLAPYAADVYIQKEWLKRFSITSQINNSNIELFLAANLEGDLTDSKIKEIKKFTSDYPAFEPLEKSFDSLKLLADKKIIYPNKTSLYKSGKKGIVIHLQRAISIAAMLIICFGIFRFYTRDNKTLEIAINKNKIDTKVEINPIVDNKSSNEVDSAGKNISIQEKKLSPYNNSIKDFTKSEKSNFTQSNTSLQNQKNLVAKEDQINIESKKSMDVENKLLTKSDSIIKPNSEQPTYEEPIGVHPMQIEQYGLAEQLGNDKNTDAKIVSLKQYLKEKLKGKIVSKKGSEKVNEEQVTNNFANTISKATGVEVNYKKEINPAEEYLSLSIGAFEYSHKKSGK